MRISTAFVCTFVCERLCMDVLNACHSNCYSTQETIIFSATSRTSCARSLFFMAEDFQMPRTLIRFYDEEAFRHSSYRVLIRGCISHTCLSFHVRVYRLYNYILKFQSKWKVDWEENCLIFDIPLRVNKSVLNFCSNFVHGICITS